ncbi:MAG: thioredoxin [Gemmatimonadetes bacterium]|nr:MAG: thioredoxin [Gemmatimonadota bacterium]
MGLFSKGQRDETHVAVTVTDDSFETDVLKSDIPVLVDFWAPWCGPCRMVGPIVEELAAEYQHKIKVCKLNTDDNPQTPQKFGIRGIPTLIFFKNGEEIDRVVGALPKPALKNKFDEVLDQFA